MVNNMNTENYLVGNSSELEVIDNALDLHGGPTKIRLIYQKRAYGKLVGIVNSVVNEALNMSIKNRNYQNKPRENWWA